MVKKEKDSRSLLERMRDSGVVKAEMLSDTSFFEERKIIPTDLPVLNIAFSGSLKGGMTDGLTILAGDSKTFKTMLSLICMRGFLNQNPDGIVIFYDIEKGTSLEYLKLNKIDTSRVVYIKDIMNIEQMKNDMVKRLAVAEENENIFFLVDSLGLLASSKEMSDALDNKEVADMTRARAITSLFRSILGYLTTKHIPCIMINHTYETQDNFHRQIVKGGKGVMLSANQVFIITSAKDKDAAKVTEGFTFTITIEKSRFVKQDSKLSFTVSFDDFVETYSGLLDLAVESGIITRAGAWYTYKDKKSYAVDITDDMWKDIVDNPDFNEFIENKFKFTH